MVVMVEREGDGGEVDGSGAEEMLERTLLLA